MEEKAQTKREKKAEYDIDYAKKNLKRIPLDMQIADYEKVKDIATRKGEAVNTFIKIAIKERIERINNGE